MEGVESISQKFHTPLLNTLFHSFLSKKRQRENERGQQRKKTADCAAVTLTKELR